MHREAKRLIGRGLIDLALILAVLRQSDVDIIPPRHFNDDALQREAFYDEGPLLGIVSAPSHHFQQQPLWGGPGLSQKYVNTQYDAIADEYESIMHNIRSQPPVVLPPQNTQNDENAESNTDSTRQHVANGNRNMITMILSMPNEPSPWQQNGGGGVQVSRNINFQPEGAVGGIGIGLPYSADENFDIFNTYVPENMRDDQIDGLMQTESEDAPNLVLNQTFPDVNWHQFIADYDNTFDNSRGQMKGFNGSFENWGNFDILNEAMQSAELFLPVATGNQNSTEIEGLVTAGSAEADRVSGLESSDITDVLESSRMELVEFSEWASQNHEDDLLFPVLPPPSYEEVMTAERVNSSTENSVSQPRQSANIIHDHNYHNSSSTPPSGSETSQNTGYAIRSRHEVSTRVITVPPRPRHISAGSDSGVSSGAGDTIDLTSDLIPDEVTTRSSVRRITTSSESSLEEVQEEETVQLGYTLDSFEIKAVDSTYFDTLEKNVGLRRKVILCN